MLRIEPPRVAVLVDTATGWGRQLIRGIFNYARKHGPWHLLIEPHGQDERMRLPTGWVGDGVIARVSTHRLAQSLTTVGVPVVNVSAIELRGVDLPRVAGRPEASGCLAGDHFLERGLRSFAYVGLLRLAYVQHHYHAFANRVSKIGAGCRVFESEGASLGNWPACQKELVQWLKSLPRSVGILTWNATAGRRVIDACRFAGLAVPEQVAVLAGDDDELLCETCSPPLSGIAVPAQQIGYEAAALLSRLIRRQRPPKKPIFIDPTGIVARQSTDTLAIDDPDLVQAVRFIREHAGLPIRVEDVLEAVPFSRRELEMRFQQVLGCSPAAEIRRVRLNQARHLLTQTDMPIPAVAAASGFGSPEYLAFAFKQDSGLTPLQYRRRVRPQ